MEFGFDLARRIQAMAHVLRYQVMVKSCLKRFTINSGNILKNMLFFDVASEQSLSTGLHSGLAAYATNVPKVGPPATLWLQLCDGRTLRVGVEMHDLSDWEEIGTLTFEVVSSADAPEMVSLPASWSDIREVQKLVYISEECEAESGFSLATTSGDILTVLPGANVYTLAIVAPFYQNSFNPENDLAVYFRKEL